MYTQLFQQANVTLTSAEPRPDSCIHAPAAAIAWPEMGQGDPGMEDLYAWDENGPRVAFKGPYGTSGQPRVFTASLVCC